MAFWHRGLHSSQHSPLIEPSFINIHNTQATFVAQRTPWWNNNNLLIPNKPLVHRAQGTVVQPFLTFNLTRWVLNSASFSLQNWTEDITMRWCYYRQKNTKGQRPATVSRSVIPVSRNDKALKKWQSSSDTTNTTESACVCALLNAHRCIACVSTNIDYLCLRPSISLQFRLSISMFNMTVHMISGWNFGYLLVNVCYFGWYSGDGPAMPRNWQNSQGVLQQNPLGILATPSWRRRTGRTSRRTNKTYSKNLSLQCQNTMRCHRF